MQPTQRRLANAIRALAMDAVEAANSGHPGLPMGMADAATALFTRHLKFDASDPALARPRPLHPVGRPRLDADLLLALPDRLRAADDRRHQALPPARQPDRRATPRISSFRGSRSPPARSARASRWRSGMAIAERHLNAIYGDELVDHRTFVIAGDGDLMEGVNHEAVGLAGHLKLGRLIVLWDDNNITIDGSTELSRNEDVLARFQAAQWHTLECDGLDAGKVGKALDKAHRRRTAEPHPVQDDHRLRRAQQAGHGSDPRRGARRRGSRGGAGRRSAGTRRRSKSPTMCDRLARQPASAARSSHAEWKRAARGERQQGRVSRPAGWRSRTMPGSSPISTG